MLQKWKYKYIGIFGLALTILLPTYLTDVFAENRKVENVPYIHQVLDTNTPDRLGNVFHGHNSCGPTSAIMIVQFHGVQPVPDSSSDAGWYVYNSHDYSDKSGRKYDKESALDMDSCHRYHNYFLGAHGYIVFQRDGYWLTNPIKLRKYLENHGLKVGQRKSGTDFEVIRRNIDAGLPLIGHLRGRWREEFFGHYLVIIGYDTGATGDQQRVVVNDPYGDITSHPHVPYGSNKNGASVTYDYPTIRNDANFENITLDWIWPVQPVDIYEEFLGWRTAESPP